ncbi:MAG: hypothetical protein Q9216_002327 [Gyalolechia sp. 2 TL-2023]
MRHFFFTAVVLLSPALASPHKKHIDSPHIRHSTNHYPIFANTTVPIGTGTGLVGPTGVSSLTGFYTSYAHSNNDNEFLTSTTLPNAPESSVEALQTVDAINANADNCAGAVTVTVPASTTETVTVSAAANNEVSSTLPVSTADTTFSSSSSTVITSLSSVLVGNTSLSGIPTFAATVATPASPAASQASSEPAAQPTSAPQVESSSVALAPIPASSTTPVAPADVTSSSSAPASSSSSSPPPADAPSPQAGLPFKTKRGIIASGNTQNELTAAIGTGKISWLGNWYSAPPPTLPSTVQFVPQNYNPDSDADGTFTKNAEAQVAKGAKHLFSYGELAAGKLSVQQIVQLFKTSMQPFADNGISVSSPTTLQNDNDFEWLEQFLQECQGCSVDFLAIHYMNTYNDGAAEELKKTLDRAHDLAVKYDIPGGVWLDNFEVVGSVEQQKGFLQEVVPWMDEREWVKAYAYVPDEVGRAGSGPNFIDGSGALNELGRFYADL